MLKPKSILLDKAVPMVCSDLPDLIYKRRYMHENPPNLIAKGGG